MATIQEKLQELAAIKVEIKQAIEAKGVTVSNDMAEFASAIESIISGGSYSEDSKWGVSATITSNVTDGVATGAETIDDTATVVITPNEGYLLPVNISVVNATYTYSSTTGVINLSNPKGDVVITVVCRIPYEEPVKSGTNLSVTQFMVIAQSGNALEVE